MLHQYNEHKYRHRRNKLVSGLKDKGITSGEVLSAIARIPRHEFVDTAFADRAYEDSALPIDMKQTISQPFTVAKQTEMLQLVPGEKVLEIGTGSGYQAAILLELGAEVYTVERHRLLYERAREILHRLDYRLMMKCGDGTEGWPAYAPYNGIVVTAGAPVVPEALVQQLSEGGRLVIPVGDETRQAMHRITREGDDFHEEIFEDYKFVPLIGRSGWNNPEADS